MDPLVIDHLSKSYGSIKAVRDISFTVEQGEIFGLIGPDGAGKTTTIRIIVSLLNADSGTVNFLEKPVHQNTVFVRSRIGYMPQRFSLYQDLTVEQNLHFFGDLFGVPKAEQRSKIERLYQFSRLGPFKNRRSGALSGGMKQKLALCCTLIHEPAVLVLDEPTVGVDPVSRSEFWDILHEQSKKGMTILVSTSYMDEASQCDYIALMHEGKIMACDTPEHVNEMLPYPIYHVTSTSPYQTYQALLSTEFKECVQLFGAGVHIMDRTGQGLEGTRAALTSLGIHMDDITTVSPQLEDVFLELMGKK